jgi:hypothetical protein
LTLNLLDDVKMIKGTLKAFIDEMLPRLARRERIPFVPFAAI